MGYGWWGETPKECLAISACGNTAETGKKKVKRRSDKTKDYWEN